MRFARGGGGKKIFTPPHHRFEELKLFSLNLILNLMKVLELTNMCNEYKVIYVKSLNMCMGSRK